MSRPTTGPETPATVTDDEGSGVLVPVLTGLAALALACIPPATFAATWDDGPRGAWTFADARNWPALRHYCLLCSVGLFPVLLLARRSLDRSRHLAAKLPAALATALAMPMIPGLVIQIAWWIGG